MDALRTEFSTLLYTASPPAGSYTFRFSSAACARCTHDRTLSAMQLSASATQVRRHCIRATTVGFSAVPAVRVAVKAANTSTLFQ